MTDYHSQEGIWPKHNWPPDKQLSDPQGLSNLTPVQYQFWLGQKLHPDTPLFNTVDTFTIRGSIQPSHFQAAFQALIDHSDALRTVFEEENGIPGQRVVNNLPYTVEYLDLSQESAPHASFQNWMKHRGKAPLDFAKRSFDTALIRISEDHFIWYLSVHHIVADGWSFYLIFNCMQDFYRRSLEGYLNEPVTFPSFYNYIEDERAYRRSPQYAADQSYWEKKPAETQLLTFYGRLPAKRPAPVRRVQHELGAERTQTLKALARQEGFAGKTLNIALFNMLAGVLAAYLHRITSNDSLSIGTPFSNRSSAVLKETVGLLMEIAPLRIAIAERDTFASLIKKVQAESAETARHCRYPLRNYENSLYDVIFNFRTGSFTTFDGMAAQENVLHSGVDGHSFSLHVRYPESDSLLLQFDFHPDVFEEPEQQRAIEHFLRTLDAFLQDPDQPISGASLLSSAERRHVLLDSNQTRVPFSEDLSIHRVFEAQTERCPDAVAVTFGKEQLTYRELNQRANQLAHHLHKFGVGPDVLVGIYMERSLDMVVGLLGILKAGGAYVPLDPAYPKERLAFMLEDSQARVLLTRQRIVDSLIEDRLLKMEDRDSQSLIPAPLSTPLRINSVEGLDSRIRPVCLEQEWEQIAHESDNNPAGILAGANLAYVIYTSGSTGQPKGIQVEHKGLVNLLHSIKRKIGISDQDILLSVATISFDMSALDLFLPLTVGARVALVSHEAACDGRQLNEQLENSRATVMQATPATWRMLLEAGWQGGQTFKVLCGGEALSLDLAKALLERSSAVWNLYGPTETTVYSTHWQVDPTCNRISVGRPIANTQAHVLDSNLQPVPAGVAGELYLGGYGVARGYHNRPELTAAKFIPNPFSGEPGARLYKTGDLARYLPDGNIEFLGRTDDQVKIRGFRIELGEIEAVLRQHPGVQQTAVIVHPDIRGEKGLAAYVTTQTDRLTIEDLRNFLKRRLPDYMVPSVFVLLENLPLTPNGKLDRKALPEPDQNRSGLEQSFVAPRNLVEETLARVWADLLKVERVSIHDNFFDLGGHSLLGTQVVSRVRSVFQVELSLRALFEAPTVAGLAEHIKRTPDMKEAFRQTE
jgi:amino acid adenylation domain-containing protein